ncbi:MAG TPA: hypothetical protein VE825_01125, partial [Terriglobales bacterium]|nr:hypothetical protein [Terriglobales bacterium]
LESSEGQRPRETAYTENVSPRGLRVLTAYLWRSREEVLITVVPSGLRRRGHVVYCVPREDGRFLAGIGWGSAPINWADVAPEVVAS